MDSIMDLLSDKSLWNDFFLYKESKKHLSHNVARDLKKFIEKEEYWDVVQKIREENPFSSPARVLLNKKNTDKKRVVFSFGRSENYVLKMLAFLLDKYDNLFSENLYSFRRGVNVKNTFSEIAGRKNISDMYCYKADIHDYFNSVDTEIMTDIIDKKLCGDPKLAEFLKKLLEDPYAFDNEEKVVCRKGIMAGVPISGFLANLYLEELDRYFFEKGVLYARYSDDIIVFGNTAEEIAEYENVIKAFLEKRRLQINSRKEMRGLPNDEWEFLGFSFCRGSIDISVAASEKLKGKMRRKARALLRWKKKKEASDERAIRAFINHFNKKLYDNPIHNDITWCRWYFPVITTEETLRELDAYMISSIRYIASGKHNKGNYNLRYETIKEYGFKSLVNSYYKWKKEDHRIG